MTMEWKESVLETTDDEDIHLANWEVILKDGFKTEHEIAEGENRLSNAPLQF